MTGPNRFTRCTTLLLTALLLATTAVAQGPRGEDKEPLVFQSAEQEEEALTAREVAVTSFSTVVPHAAVDARHLLARKPDQFRRVLRSSRDVHDVR